jgi:sugar lactone lactonase YvrE
MKRVSPSAHRAVRSVAVFCPLDRISLKTLLSVVLAVTAGTVSPALPAQTAHFSGVQINLPPEGDLTAIAVDGSGKVYIADGDSKTVLVEAPSAGRYTESTILIPNLSCPAGLAVDGSGDLYITDFCTNMVWKETPSAGSYLQSAVPTSGLDKPAGVAVDGSGNVYIADRDHSRVLKETPATGGSYSESTISSDLLNPDGVAVDGSGNVYIADTDHSRVLKETFSEGRYTASILRSNVSADGVAVDNRGNVYVADTGTSRVLKESVAAGASYSESIVPSVSYPEGVAVDGSGNVYIDDGNNDVLKVEPVPSFGAVSVGSSGLTASMLFTIDTAGALGLPVVVTQGAGTEYADAGSGSCTLDNGPNHPYRAGQTCAVDMTFAPKSSGLLYGGAVLTDSTGAVIATGEISGTGVTTE